MLEESFNMSAAELDRFIITTKVNDKLLTQEEAGKILNISTRQVRRLLKAWRLKGAAGLINKKRGHCGRKPLNVGLKNQITHILRSVFYDYGPTLAAEKLGEYHKIQISKESVRTIMVKEELWKPRVKKERKIHPPRERRPNFGELVQIDGSVHDWFEGRGPRCTLLVFVDDATSTILALKFVECESSLGYFSILKDYILRYGKPRAFYSDKHGVFRVNSKGANDKKEGFTQFGRVLDELDVQLIYAHSPQAKGRVERLNGVLQDRLTKDLRYHNISTIEQANEYLDQFRINYNIQFSKKPKHTEDLHRPLCEQEIRELETLCSIQTKRKLSKDRTLRYKNTIYKVHMPGKDKSLCQASVTVCENESAEITIFHKNKPLPYTVYKESLAYGEILTQRELQSFLNQKMSLWRPVKSVVTELPNWL